MFPPWGEYEQGEWQVDDPLMSFVEIGNYRGKLNEEAMLDEKEEDIEKLFEAERAGFEAENRRIMEEEDRKWRPIKEEVHFRGKTMMIEDPVESANDWLQSIQRRFSKKQLFGSKPEHVAKVEPKVNPQDEIDFTTEVY